MNSELKKLVKIYCKKDTIRVFVMHVNKTEVFSQRISEEIGVDS